MTPRAKGIIFCVVTKPLVLGVVNHQSYKNGGFPAAREGTSLRPAAAFSAVNTATQPVPSTQERARPLWFPLAGPSCDLFMLTDRQRGASAVQTGDPDGAFEVVMSLNNVTGVYKTRAWFGAVLCFSPSAA